MKNEIIQRLKALIAFMQNEKNYYAMFRNVLESCAVAIELNQICFSEQFISDSEFVGTSRIINSCRQKAIEIHRDWIIKRLESSKTEHTKKSIIMSVYNDIF